MSTRSDDRASRAEARRRARLAARGELNETDAHSEETSADAQQPRSGGGFLRRLFPPAPPLPDRPDPLAGFDRGGPLTPVSERIFLLRANLLAWIAPGIVGFLGLWASRFYGNSLLGLIATFALFGSLIAAGWIGWQRPTLYGTAAALVAFVLGYGMILFLFAQMGAGPDTFGGPGAIAGELMLAAVYQAGLGFIGGWYGGYLRRRQTQLSSQARRKRR